MAPCANVVEALARVEASSGEKSTAYEALLASIKTLSSPATAVDDLNAIADSFFGQSLGVVATRSVLGSFVSTLTELGSSSFVSTPTQLGGSSGGGISSQDVGISSQDVGISSQDVGISSQDVGISSQDVRISSQDVRIQVGTRTLSRLASSQPSSFLDAAATLCELVATAHEEDDDFAAAARVLAEMPLDSSQRKVTDEERARVWVRIVRNHLEVDDPMAADAYVSKLKNIMYAVADQDLVLHFRLSQARIQDAKREFLPAAQRYHEISLSPAAIADDERLHTLAMAIKCAVLAPAGPLRSRMLGRLYRDDRAVQLPEFGILENMFLDRLLSQAEVDAFAEGLQPHQLATTADGSTVLARAVVEHNLLGASRLYSNIGFDALGSLLGLDADKAEETTARMIEQGRLVGRMDQLDGVVCFEGGEASGEKGSGRADAVAGKEMRRWDANVEGLAEEVENVTNLLQNEFPDFVAANLVV